MSGGEAARSGPTRAAVTLLWIPLGAGGAAIVRASGRVYERFRAAAERRPPVPLYHTALVVEVDGERHIVENAWPSPDDNRSSRGVIVVGPVFFEPLGRFRPFRYEVRRWQHGVIADADLAVASDVVSVDVGVARRTLSAVETVPALTWGRHPLDAGEMWNSNSVIAFVLASAGLPAGEFEPPAGGRAPGWTSGLAAAPN